MGERPRRDSFPRFGEPPFCTWDLYLPPRRLAPSLERGESKVVHAVVTNASVRISDSGFR
jgi:hypothetical protein